MTSSSGGAHSSDFPTHRSQTPSGGRRRHRPRRGPRPFCPPLLAGDGLVYMEPSPPPAGQPAGTRRGGGWPFLSPSTNIRNRLERFAVGFRLLPQGDPPLAAPRAAPGACGSLNDCPSQVPEVARGAVQNNRRADRSPWPPPPLSSVTSHALDFLWWRSPLGRVCFALIDDFAAAFDGRHVCVCGCVCALRRWRPSRGTCCSLYFIRCSGH